MIESAINRVLDLAIPEEMLINERTYTTRKIHPVLEPTINELNLHTLTGLKDYLFEGIDLDHTAKRTVLHVIDFDITDGLVKSFSDDGVSQQVSAKAGITRIAEVPLPNPVTLRPFRTFHEIPQPAGPFVFRMRSGDPEPDCALFDADGGAWKNQAIQGIAAWLRENIPGVPVIA